MLTNGCKELKIKVKKMFDDIRPYNDIETGLALKRVAASPLIEPMVDFLFPGQNSNEFRALLSSVESVDDFQQKAMSKAIESIVKQTTAGLTCNGIEYFRSDNDSKGVGIKKFLMLSNHRDIVLDSAFIQILFFRNSLPLSEIAVGDNLMINPFIEDLIRSNRMIKVIRSDNPREVYAASKVLSEYIREKITSNESSIWLAHRNGRTKDGFDVTEQGLIKMLDMSGRGDFVDDFEEISIMPVSVSYEYEPCDLLKAIEVWYTKEQGGYKKKGGEDLVSILTGLKQKKGNVHVNFCKPITREELEEADSYEKNDKFRKLAEIMDSRILPAFKLWPNNYVAADMLEKESGNSKIKDFSSFYTPIESKTFNEYVEKQIDKVPEGVDKDAVKKIFIGIYATPVHNR